jgi:hypothetical protein
MDDYRDMDEAERQDCKRRMEEMSRKCEEAVAMAEDSLIDISGGRCGRE